MRSAIDTIPLTDPSDLEKQIVFLTNRLILVLNRRCFRSILARFSLANFMLFYRQMASLSSPTICAILLNPKWL